MSGISPERPQATSTHAATACQHLAAMPTFDPVKAKTMDAWEVRRTFPRFYGNCPTCGQQVIVYASLAHYVAGDW
jgi:hypothetical protein